MKLLRKRLKQLSSGVMICFQFVFAHTVWQVHILCVLDAFILP